MRIIVCVKEIPDVKAPLEIDSQGAGLWEDGVCYMANPADAAAVEEAVGIKKTIPGCEVILLGFGSLRARTVLRECLALGGDRAVLVRNDGLNTKEPFIVAAILAEAIRQLQGELVLCGSLAPDTNDGSVGPVLAEKLSYGVVHNVDQINIEPHGHTLTAYRLKERGDREVVRIGLPAVVTVNERANQPHYASLPDYLEAWQKEVEMWEASRLGIPPSEVYSASRGKKFIGLTPPKPRLKKGFTIDSSLSAEERIRMLMTGGISQKKTNLLEGSKENLVRQLWEYLKQAGLLELEI